MEIFSSNLSAAASTTALGLVYDTDAPADGEKSIHNAVNEAVCIKMLVKSIRPTAVPYSFSLVPQIPIVTFNGANFYPAWVESPNISAFPDITAPRIVPKVRLAALDQRAPSALVNLWPESVAQTILAHKAGNSSNQFISTSNYCNQFPMYSNTVEGWFVCADYDFGGEIELKALVGFNAGSTAQAQMLLGVQQTYVQALISDVWTDVIHTYDSLRTTTNWAQVRYTLPASVKAQKFRIVNKAASWPFGTAGFYPFSLQFYGNYTGQKPKTIGKMKHMTVLNLASTPAYQTNTAWSFNVPIALTTAMGRYTAMTHLTITDDLAKAGSHDIYMPDVSYRPEFGEFPLPSFRVVQSSAVGRGV